MASIVEGCPMCRICQQLLSSTFGVVSHISGKIDQSPRKALLTTYAKTSPKKWKKEKKTEL